MRFKKISQLAILTLLSWPGKETFAQDFHLSQYESSPMYLNPAMTGMFNGNYRIGLQHRSQWKNVAFKPFTTSALSFDNNGKKIKLGGYIINSKAGSGDYSVLNVVLSAAYDYNRNGHHFSGGLQGGIINKSIDFNALTYSAQYTSANGGNINSTLPSGETFPKASIMMPETNVGLLYYNSKAEKRFNPFLGFSAAHLTQPQESFFGHDNKLPIRYVIHGGSKINISEKVQFTLHVLKMMQTNANELTFNVLANHYLKNADSYLIYGASYRNEDAMLAHLGLKHKSLIYRLSYDINSSTLKPISGGRGGYEFSIVYIMKKTNINPVQLCPRI